MLWVKFNSNGQYIGGKNVGSLPFAGTDEFQIFAVFEDINLDNYGAASLKLYKPDLQAHSDTVLAMTKRTGIVFDGEENAYFTVGTAYDGFYFDFRDFANDDGSEILDTAGMWRAVITLLNVNPAYNTLRNVQGSVTFEVGNGNESEESGNVSLDDILTNLYRQLGNKLNISSPDYVKTVNEEDISLFSFEDAYNVGDVILNRYDLKVYQLDENKEPVFKLDLLDLYTQEEIDAFLSGKLDKITTSVKGAYVHIGDSQIEIIVDNYATSNTIAQRVSGGHINVGLTPTSTEHATSKKYVDDNIKNVREVAEGKNKTIVIRYDENVPTSNAAARNRFKPDGTAFTDLADFNSYVSGLTFANSYFNSQDDLIAPLNLYLIDVNRVVYTNQYMADNFKVGDIVLVWQLDVPDRWIETLMPSIVGFYKLETSKVDLSAYYTSSQVDSLLDNKADKSDTYTKTETDTLLGGKQNTLVSGVNIKTLTVDGVEKSLLGTGTIEVGTGSGGGAWGEITGDIQDQTDLQNELQDIREVAEGKCKTYVLSYSTTAPVDDLYARMYKKPDGTAFTDLADFNSYVSGLTLGNADFYSQNATITEISKYFITNDYVVYTYNYLVNTEKLKKGDIFLITETDVPDRWVSSASSAITFNKLETSKVDLTSYATTGDLAMARYETNLMFAPEYFPVNTYSVGDVVYHGNKIYRCITAIETPETWDSTHWQQITVASDFVNLTGIQTISGEKTFDDTDLKIKKGNYTWTINQDTFGQLQIYRGSDSSAGIQLDAGLIRCKGIAGRGNNLYDLGTSNFYWKDLYLSGNIQLKNTNSTHYYTINSNEYGNLSLNFDGTSILAINNTNGIIVKNKVSPLSSSTFDLGDSSHTWKDLYLGGTAYTNSIKNPTSTELKISSLDESGYHRVITAGYNLVCQYYNGSTLVKANWADYGSEFELNEPFVPMVNNTYDLGKSAYQWRDGYFAGQVYAQNTFNVINASDITASGSNFQLTQAQYDTITNGKPTIISGTLGAYTNNVILLTGLLDGTIWYGSCATCNYGHNRINGYSINPSTLIMAFGRNTGSRIELEGERLNGKALPNYPSSPTTSKVLTYGTDNNLSWGDGIFNVINATDITNNALSSDQLAIVGNGRPTIILGDITISGNIYTNMFIATVKELYGNYYAVAVACGSSGNTQIASLYIAGANGTIQQLAQSGSLSLRNVANINGKSLPAFPNSPTIAQQLIYDTDNSLKWLGAGLIDFGELTSDTTSAVMDYINENGGKFIYTDANLNKWCCIKLPKTSRTGQLASLCYICSITGEGGNFYLCLGYINTSTKEFSHQRDIFTGVVHSDALDNFAIKKINNKDIKFYQNNVFPYANNTGTEIKYETINDISVSADTTFTLATAPTTTYPEYKVNLTNSAASAVTLTFTGVSKVKTNDSSFTITEGTNSVVVLPAGASVELNIQNGKMIVYNWNI